MKNHFNVKAYLEHAERNYSAANGSYSNFYSNNELDLGFAGADGPAPVAAPVAQAKQPSPYQLNISNTTAGDLTCVLFGANIYLLTTNFGSDTGVTVTPSQTNVSYLQLIQQSTTQPFETSLLRIQSSNTTQVTQQITITSTDANGQSCNIPLIVQNYFSSYQFQSGIVDVPFPVRIDGNTYLTFTVLDNTSLSMTFFPADKFNASRTFNGVSALQNYAAPAVALGMPTYIAPSTGPGYNRSAAGITAGGTAIPSNFRG